MQKILSFMVLAAIALTAGCGKKKDENTLNFGFFPNVTHAQGVIAYQMSLEGRGWYEERLGVKINWYDFNAGNDAMNALAGRQLDVTYVGPNPAINTYTRTKGAEIRIISGAADGGSALVVNPKLNIQKASDLKGKKIATPQYANTQDVACRAWLKENGLSFRDGDGEVTIVPAKNPEQLSLFSRGSIDACWTVEPWISRLENVGGKIFINKPEAVTTILVSSAAKFNSNPELIKKIYKAHGELTTWINENPEEAKRLVLKGIESVTSQKLDRELIDSSWKRITFTSKVNRQGIEKFVDQSVNIGFLDKKMDMEALFPDIEKIGTQN